jgi:hypothetical protein
MKQVPYRNLTNVRGHHTIFIRSGVLALGICAPLYITHMYKYVYMHTHTHTHTHIYIYIYSFELRNYGL